MGIQRPRKERKNAATLGKKRPNVFVPVSPESPKASLKTNTFFSLPEEPPAHEESHNSDPSPTTPRKLFLPKAALAARSKKSPGCQSNASEKTCATNGTGLEDFEDFWGDDTEMSPDEADADGAEMHRMNTPRKGEEPLHIFKVATPPSSPKPKPVEKTRFVPHWPFGTTWPFCCAPTTLELRGLPRECTEEVLVNQLDAWGFAGKYDLVYIPKRRGAGDLAIVNAVRYADGCSIAGRLHEFSNWKVSSSKTQVSSKIKQVKRKVCRVSWSFTCQGMDSLVQEYHQSDEAWDVAPDGSYKGPWLFQHGAWTPLFLPGHMWPTMYTGQMASMTGWDATQSDFATMAC